MDFDERVDVGVRRFRKWKESLLDISKRSEQLQPDLHKMIEVLHPDASTLFRVLVIYDQPCEFIPVYRGSGGRKKAAAVKGKAQGGKAQGHSGKGDDSVRGDPGGNAGFAGDFISESDSGPEIPDAIIREYGLTQNHVNALKSKMQKAKLAEIITPYSDKKLKERISALIKKSEQTEEELGVSILYATFGLLNWADYRHDNIKGKTPILFVPIAFELDKSDGHYRLKIISDDAFINPALKIKLQDLRISVPDFPSEFDSGDVIDFWDAFRDAIRFERDWYIEDRVFIGAYFFSKIALFNDLDNYESEMLEHPIIKSLAERSGYKEFPENVPNMGDLADLSNPIRSYHIVDADSSQSEAILYARKGSSIVIQGPPGTGKSQCITNIIAEALAHDKRVLFVAQKRAALDVVYKRLESCGLGRFCLVLHSQNANKSEVLRHIAEGFDSGVRPKDLDNEKYFELKRITERLDEYVRLITQPNGERGLSLYDIIGHLIRLKNVPFVDGPIKDPETISEEEFVEIKDYLEQLEGFRKTMEEYDKNPWVHARITDPLLISNQLIPHMKRILRRLESALTALRNNLGRFHTDGFYRSSYTSRNPRGLYNMHEDRSIGSDTGFGSDTSGDRMDLEDKTGKGKPGASRGVLSDGLSGIDSRRDGIDSRRGGIDSRRTITLSPDAVGGVDGDDKDTRCDKGYREDGRDGYGEDDRRASTTKWDAIIRKSAYLQYVFENLFGFWREVNESFEEIRNYFVLDDIIPVHVFFDYFSPFKQILAAFSGYLSGEGAMKKPPERFLLERLREYIEKVEDFNINLKVFNITSGLEPIRSEADLFEYKRFFDKFNPEALTLDVNLLMGRFTTDYTRGLKRMGSDFKRDRDLILSTVRDPDPEGDVMAYLGAIKRFCDRYGSFANSSKSFIRRVYSDFLGLYGRWEGFQELESFLFPLFSIERLPDYPLEESYWDSYLSFCRFWQEHMDELNDWFEIEVRKYRLYELGVGGFFEALKNAYFKYPDSDEPAGSDVPYALLFEKTYYMTWYNFLIEALPPIKNFKQELFEELRLKFNSIDRQILLLNRIRILNKLLKKGVFSEDRLPPHMLPQLGMIKRELKKKRNIIPIRRLFTEARDYITGIKPVFMMSPLSIAHYLAAESYRRYFDIVIFDEASQITPEDGIGAIYRGKSAVIVGDSQQMPPTSFFSTVRPESDLDAYDIESANMESLLDECTGIGLREKMLRFHYRSRKEELIAFSNFHYYNGKLYTFPDLRVPRSAIGSMSNAADALKKSPSMRHGESGCGNIIDLPAITFIPVEKGRKEKGRNPIEAMTVAEFIIKHYRENLRCNTSYSLGVIAFSQAQQEEIRKALMSLLKREPDLNDVIFRNGGEPLFIKNLENAQGDERDFIFFSIGYARDSKGKLTQNFGPLNKSGGYRRLNVAITRARYHIKIFASFYPSDFNYDEIKSEGLRHLIDYMIFAQTGSIPLESNMPSIPDYPERFTVKKDVKESLMRLGYTVHEDIGRSSFKIDLAVGDPVNSGRFKLAIELDSGSYSEAALARDRERIRPDVLKSLGWRIYHIWTPEWFRNKERILGEIDGILKG